jgi:UPF0755 protein
VSRGQRSAEERERARLEREAKRAAREGRPPPASPPPTEVPPPEWRPSLDGHEEVLPEPLEEEILPEPEPEPVAYEPPPEPVYEPEPLPPEPEEILPEPPEEEFLPEPEPALAPPPRLDLPTGIGAAGPVAPAVVPPRPPPPFPGRDQARGAAATEMLERRRAAMDVGGGEGRARGGEGRTRRPLRWVALAFMAAIVLGACWFAFSLFQPFKGDGGAAVRVRIPEGASVGDIADVLKRRGVISSPFFFQTRAAIAGRRDDFKAGTFTLRRDMSLAAAMDVISTGPAPDVVRVAIPEGDSRNEVSRIVGHRLRGNYVALTRRSARLDPRRYGARRATSLEGFLFPATYEIKKGKPTSALVSEQLDSFKRAFAGVNMGFAKKRNLSAYDVLTMASMIEREAQVASERPLVASVIYNRLREGIPLGIDATIRYATGNWTRPLTQSQLGVDSPYNTRTRRGLPPGPIGSPGMAAIRAAANPAHTKYLFYVVKPGTCGRHAFSRTDAEFQRDVRRYNTERARRGGKSPTSC